MTGSQLAFAPSTSLGRSLDVGDSHLKGIVHFKLFVAVQGSGETVEHGIDSVAVAFSPFSDTHPPSVEIPTRESIGTVAEEEAVVIVQVGDFVQHTSHGAS